MKALSRLLPIDLLILLALVLAFGAAATAAAASYTIGESLADE